MENFNEKLYGLFLANVIGCKPDACGNHPCDNGVCCNECEQEWALRAWEEFEPTPRELAEL